MVEESTLGKQHNHMNKLYLFLSSLWLGLSWCGLGQGAFSLSAKAQATLDAAIKESGVLFGFGVKEQQAMDLAGRAFDSALEKLAGEVGTNRASQVLANERRDIQSKLLAIALDRQQRPEVYLEINNRYIDRYAMYRPERRFIRSPNFEPIHVNEKYRLAWEYFLLRPPLKDTLALYDLRAIQALSDINNEASVVTLLYCFEVTLPAGKINVDRVKSRQSWILNAIIWYPTEQGLKALLK
jgi:hypothetical protein